MSNDYLFHAGEATVRARAGQFTDAMPEIVFGRASGPVGRAFASMMTQCHGASAMFAIRACSELVQPSTIVVPKVTLKDVATIELFGGVVKRATADAVVDCVIDGVIPRAIASELRIISLVWIDPRCAQDPNLDRKDLYRTHHEATKLAIRRALNHEPCGDAPVANGHETRPTGEWS